MSDSIWNYRDDIDPRRPEREDEHRDERGEGSESSGVPMPPAASPTDAPLVDASESEPMLSDAPVADEASLGTSAQGIEIIGYDVEATDGGLGKIDESSLEAGSSYVVVDTGWWIFGKKRMIPAGVIQSIDHENGQVFVGLTKEEIKTAPDFSEEHRDDRSGYDEYYGPYGQ